MAAAVFIARYGMKGENRIPGRADEVFPEREVPSVT